MCAASVLHSFRPVQSSPVMPGPVLPMDMAMRCLYIGHSSSSPPAAAPLRGFLSSYNEDLRLQRASKRHGAMLCKPCLRGAPLRPCLSGQQNKKQSAALEAAAPPPRRGSVPGEKRVVFADSRGMSLTAVHVFSKFDEFDPFFAPPRRRRSADDELLQFDMLDLDGLASPSVRMDIAAASRGGNNNNNNNNHLTLDFRQPSADYLDFRRRLQRDAVCLESCALQQRSLTGTVRVRNLGFSKAVSVRVTFDGWASHSDVAAAFMNNVYGCPDADTFAFTLELPDATDSTNSSSPNGGVEFCVRFEAEGRTFWDNNDGTNYRLKCAAASGWGGGAGASAIPDRTKPSEHHNGDASRTCGGGGGGGGGGAKLLDVLELDQFGSPRTSSGLFPGWQSWGHVDASVPYW